MHAYNETDPNETPEAAAARAEAANPPALLPAEAGSWLSDAYPPALPFIRNAYAAGLAARYVERLIPANPHLAGSDHAHAWELGFRSLALTDAWRRV